MPRDPLGDRARVFGIRHHGPGSARSLLAALDEWRPEQVLIEGPAEAERLLEYLTCAEVRPPVSMLFYDLETPRWAVYYPLAEFSPELQAVRWAQRNGANVRFMDLPASALVGLQVVQGRSSDVMDSLARAAGFEDVEDWWEHLVEHRSDATSLFEGLEALMAELRQAEVVWEDVEEPELEDDPRPRVGGSVFQELREEQMRRSVREALKATGRLGIVCGAWHAPALRQPPGACGEELKRLPKRKVGSTIAPWTFDRLTFASGYGAGARSPAFYDLLWSTPPEEVTRRWMVLVARLMRGEDLEASSASVIEAVRLAEALAALRGRPRPGLRELCDAAGSVLVRDEAVWRLIERRLIVGERMGEVPDTIPAVPLQADLRAQQRRLRLPVDNTDRKLELDLRGETDLERSRLLHRLTLLGVTWGAAEGVHGKKGTFHEHWRLQWRPELEIQVIEASPWGNTVLEAATARAADELAKATSLSAVAHLVELVLLADLSEAIEPAVTKLLDLSATAADVADLADSLPPLVGMQRYGTVRCTEAERLAPVIDAVFARLCIGLPGACSSLDDEAAALMSRRLSNTAGVVRLVEDEEKPGMWLDCLRTVAERRGVHFLVAGKAERLRFDFGAIGGEELAGRLRREASAGATALETAAFVEGLLEGSGTILLHQEALWRAVDEWVAGIEASAFDETLPLIRRTFALFSRAERRQIGERVSGGEPRAGMLEMEIDEERALRVLPVLRRILGVAGE